MVFVSMYKSAKKNNKKIPKNNYNNLTYFIYLFERNLVFYVEINENDMHEHGNSACGKQDLSFILSL